MPIWDRRIGRRLLPGEKAGPGDVEREIDAFIRHIANSLLKIEIILLFHENPNLIDSAGGVASRLRRDRKEVLLAMKSFQERGILSNISRWGRAVYNYNPSPEVKKIIDLFVRQWTDPYKHPRIMAKVLEAEGRRG